MRLWQWRLGGGCVAPVAMPAVITLVTCLVQRRTRMPLPLLFLNDLLLFLLSLAYRVPALVAPECLLPPLQLRH